jgi:hypothetical protein
VQQPLRLVGKLGGRGRVAAVAPGKLLYLRDQHSGVLYLVDSGAAFSIIPHSSSAPASGPPLTGPAGQPISCWGEKVLSLNFGGHRFQYSFLLAAVAFPIIGIDFLAQHALTVNPAAGIVSGRGFFLRTSSAAARPACGHGAAFSRPPRRPHTALLYKGDLSTSLLFSRGVFSLLAGGRLICPTLTTSRGGTTATCASQDRC